MDSIKVLSIVQDDQIRDMKKRELVKYVHKLRKFVLKQNDKITYQKSKIENLKLKLKDFDDGSTVIKPAEPKESNPILDQKSEAADPPEKLNFIEEITAAAEEAQNRNGMVYEPTSGLYYDFKTGYYYNAEYGLYYDGNNGKYYTYDQSSNEFKYHSTAAATVVEQKNVDQLVVCGKGKKKGRKREKISDDVEEGELSSEESMVEDNSSDDNNHFYDDLSKHYPPSLRLIVHECSLPKLKVGTLFVITYKGGSLGREAEHDVVIPDINVSKFHLKFSYDEENAVYTVLDLGSRNGTILNGERMSVSQVESEPMSLPHGSVIQISETKLVCHIHEGNATCENCEPGLLIKSEPQTTAAPAPVSHKTQLKLIQKKYGLENEKYVESKSDPGYNDRAEQRRIVVGSSSSHEKTETASVNASIPKKNKGFKMLSKLGWKEGQGLGKQNDNALLEPINVKGNPGTKGLGSTEQPVAPALTGSIKRKTEKKQLIWKKTQQRYLNSTNSTQNTAKVNIFGNSDDEESM